MEKEFTLRNKIEEAKAEYLKRYQMLDWQWTDEGLPCTNTLISPCCVRGGTPFGLRTTAIPIPA